MKRNVVCLNLLLKQKNTLKNKLASWIYKQALLADNFHATVTSREYGKWLNKSLGINVEYTLLHDVFHDYLQFFLTVGPKKGALKLYLRVVFEGYGNPPRQAATKNGARRHGPLERLRRHGP